MPRELTIMLVRDSGQAPFTLRLRTWSMLVLSVLAVATAGVCLWAGWQIGELTFAL
jgi:hypothetical protein